MSAAILVSGLLMGLLGGTHCIVMCGGVVGMMCSALPLTRRARLATQVPYVLAYNAGRIASYVAAGGLAGAVGASVASFGTVQRSQMVLRLVAGAMMIVLGFYLAGLARPLRWIERMGEPVWKRVAPMARLFVPVGSPAQALALGALWGWMPCGLVYAALAVAVSSGSLVGGTITMAAFGLGTLPTLVTMGCAAAVVSRLARDTRVRAAAGVIMVAYGVVQTTYACRAWIDVGLDAVCCASHHPA